MNNSNILAALAGALPRCQSLAGNDHAARLASCIASRQHTHNCPRYPWTDPKVETTGEQHLFEIKVYLDGLSADECREMKRIRQRVGAINGYIYRVEIITARPATDYTARLIPQYTRGAVPLEAAHILWPC